MRQDIDSVAAGGGGSMRHPLPCWLSTLLASFGGSQAAPPGGPKTLASPTLPLGSGTLGGSFLPRLRFWLARSEQEVVLARIPLAVIGRGGRPQPPPHLHFFPSLCPSFLSFQKRTSPLFPSCLSRRWLGILAFVAVRGQWVARLCVVTGAVKGSTPPHTHTHTFFTSMAVWLTHID